eukprot:g10625.t1
MPSASAGEDPDVGIRILPSRKAAQPTDWKELFKEDLDSFNHGVELRASATLPCGAKVSKSQFSFTRRHWEATTLTQGALQNGNPQNLFNGGFCDAHPANVAWWWAVHGCEKCKLTVEAQKHFFTDRIVKKDRQRFPGFVLQNPALEVEADTGSVDHPLLRPPSPLPEPPGRKRSISETRARDKRHYHIREKYPYRQARTGTDTNPKNFSYQVMKTAPDVRDLARKHTRPPVPWH